MGKNKFKGGYKKYTLQEERRKILAIGIEEGELEERV
jgi:hypothetical protein